MSFVDALFTMWTLMTVEISSFTMVYFAFLYRKLHFEINWNSLKRKKQARYHFSYFLSRGRNVTVCVTSNPSCTFVVEYATLRTPCRTSVWLDCGMATGLLLSIILSIVSNMYLPGVQYVTKSYIKRKKKL